MASCQELADGSAKKRAAESAARRRKENAAAERRKARGPRMAGHLWPNFQRWTYPRGRSRVRPYPHQRLSALCSPSEGERKCPPKPKRR